MTSHGYSHARGGVFARGKTSVCTCLLLSTLITSSLHSRLPPLALLLLLALALAIAAGTRTALELGAAALPLVAVASRARPPAGCWTCSPTTTVNPFHART
jgi:hypothetical protein